MSKYKDDLKKYNDDWMSRKWRPAAAMTYMALCVLDFGVFPVIWAIVQVLTNHPLIQWNPITLQGAGLFHISFGAILGISAFGRTQEKINGVVPLPPTQEEPIK